MNVWMYGIVLWQCCVLVLAIDNTGSSSGMVRSRSKQVLEAFEQALAPRMSEHVVQRRRRYGTVNKQRKKINTQTALEDVRRNKVFPSMNRVVRHNGNMGNNQHMDKPSPKYIQFRAKKQMYLLKKAQQQGMALEKISKGHLAEEKMEVLETALREFEMEMRWHTRNRDFPRGVYTDTEKVLMRFKKKELYLLYGRMHAHVRIIVEAADGFYHVEDVGNRLEDWRNAEKEVEKMEGWLSKIVFRQPGSKVERKEEMDKVVRHAMKQDREILTAIANALDSVYFRGFDVFMDAINHIKLVLADAHAPEKLYYTRSMEY